MRKKTSRRNIIVKKHTKAKAVWKDLPEDILVTIFKKLDKKSLFKTAYSVCRWWRSISRFILYWSKQRGVNVLDLGRFKNIGVDEESQLMKLLKRMLDGLEQKSEIVTRIDLPENINLSDDFLNYMAQRLPKLIHLQLPGTIGMITTVGFSKAIRNWGEMKTLCMGSIKLRDYSYTIHEIDINIQNMEVLNMYTNDMEVGMKNGQTFVLDEYISLQIAKNLRGMKALIFKNCILSEIGLKNIICNCKCLETIWILRCRIPKLDCLQTEYVTYIMTKRAIEDNTIDWSMRMRGNVRINSTPSILKYFSQFEEQACDEDAEKMTTGRCKIC